MANTVIQLKWSEVTTTPTTLNVAEPAYSNVSNKLFIGLSDNSVVAVGGKYYTDLVDAATSSNTVLSLVKRDASGGFNATYVRAAFFGNANTASKWETARNIGVEGDATGIISVDGSANANIPLTLNNTAVTPGNYGGSTSIPTFSVDSKGRVTYAANVSVATSLSFAGDSGTGSLSILSDTLTVKGGDGISSVAVDANNTVVLDVDNTVVRTTGAQTISGDLSVTGNLVVSGDTVTQDVSTIRTEDSLIKLAANNVSDSIDIGFYGEYFDGAAKYAGLIRDASDGGKFKLFIGETTDPTNNVVTYDSSNRATLDANFTGGTVSSLSSAIAVADGGTGRTTFTKGAILVGNATGGLTELANVSVTTTNLGAANTINSVTTDSYGRITAVSTTPVSIAASQISSGLVAVNRGGTNNDTYTTGAGLFYDGSKITTLANTGTAGTYGSSSYLPVITTDAYGRVSSVSNTAISIPTSAIASGTLGVARGGTGAASFTVKGVIVSDSSSTTGALSALTSSTEGHVLQINSSGVPTFAHLNGGSF